MRIYADGQEVLQIDLDESSGTEEHAYLHRDALSSVLFHTDAAGESSQLRDFDVFGQQVANPSWATDVLDSFTGHELDEEFGLVNMGARLYDPKFGVFTTPDPLIQSGLWSQGMNPYAYANNDPVNLFDPTGMEACNSGYWDDCDPTDSTDLKAPPGTQPLDVPEPTIVVREPEPVEPVEPPVPEADPLAGGWAGSAGMALANDPMGGLLPAQTPGRGVGGGPALTQGEQSGTGNRDPSAGHRAMTPEERAEHNAEVLSVVAMVIPTGWLLRTVLKGSSLVLLRTPQALQKFFMKHGADFGLKGNWNPARAAEASRAIHQHINSPGVRAIQGTYRGNQVIHFVDPRTGLNVISGQGGNFVSGWATWCRTARRRFVNWTALLNEVNMKLELSEDEALIFFEWLARLDERDALPCEDDSEKMVLWSLHGQLERQLVEPFRPNYRELVEQARARLKGNGES